MSVSYFLYTDAIPLLFCICDEPMLAIDLAKRKPSKSPRVLDRRFSRSPSARVDEKEEDIGGSLYNLLTILRGFWFLN